MPTKTISETALIAYDFSKANLKAPLLSIAPFLLVCTFIKTFAMPNYQAVALIGLIGSGYLYAMFASHMHRAFINGTPATAINIFKPGKDDWRFIGMSFLLFLISFGVSFGVIFVFTAALHQTGIAIGVIALLFLIPFIVRLMILLPDRAVGGHLSMKESLRISHGMFWRIFLTPLLAGWRLLLGGFVYVFLAVFITEMIIRTTFPTIADEHNAIHKLILFVIQTPVTIIMAYWVAAIGIAGLSNYYLLAKQENNID